MINVLLTSPDFVRLNSSISDNVNSKVLASAIREVQDTEIQEIIGQPLMEKLQELIRTGDIELPVNLPYKNALDKAQMLITYRVVAELTIMLNFKLDNAGVVQSRDENMDYTGFEDTMSVKKYWDTKASHYTYLLQNYLMEHRDELPELTEYQCWKIKSTLYSAASPGVFLGGARGRGYWRIWPYRCQYGMNFPNRRV